MHITYKKSNLMFVDSIRVSNAISCMIVLNIDINVIFFFISSFIIKCKNVSIFDYLSGGLGNISGEF